MNDPYRTECRAVAELLVALLTDELETERAAQLQTHLEHCQACQAELETLRQAQQHAAMMRLESPALDRYPDFLWRLADDEVTRSPQTLVHLTEPSELVVALSEPKLAGIPPPNTGLAAVIPLFGRRLLVRNGFGQGFELTMVSAQGRELLRLTATSLARVAAVAAGISVFAGIAFLVLVLFWFPHWLSPAIEPQTARPTTPFAGATHYPEAKDNDPWQDWVQTFSNANITLAVWPSGDQLLTSRLTATEATPPMPLRDLPHELHPQPLTPLSLAGATDGHSYVLVREQAQRLQAWHLSMNAPPALPSPLPFPLTENGMQPSLVWSGDRYLLAYVRPSLQTPVIKLLELGPGGRALDGVEMIAAETEDLDKVGWPSLVAKGSRGALFFITESGQLQGRPLVRATGQLEFGNRVVITRLQRRNHTPLRMLPVADGYLICWGERDPQGTELRLARLNEQLQVQSVKTLAAGEWPISALDWRATTQGFVVVWAEERPDGPQLFTQTFQLDGTSSQQPEALHSSFPRRVGVSFGDPLGRTFVWPERQPDGSVGLGRKLLRE